MDDFCQDCMEDGEYVEHESVCDTCERILCKQHLAQHDREHGSEEYPASYGLEGGYESSPAYRSSMRDAGRGGLLKW